MHNKRPLQRRQKYVCQINSMLWYTLQVPQYLYYKSKPSAKVTKALRASDGAERCSPLQVLEKAHKAGYFSRYFLYFINLIQAWLVKQENIIVDVNESKYTFHILIRDRQRCKNPQTLFGQLFYSAAIFLVYLETLAYFCLHLQVCMCFGTFLRFFKTYFWV